jgi:hypothetical protein
MQDSFAEPTILNQIAEIDLAVRLFDDHEKSYSGSLKNLAGQNRGAKQSSPIVEPESEYAREQDVKTGDLPY